MEEHREGGSSSGSGSSGNQNGPGHPSNTPIIPTVPGVADRRPGRGGDWQGGFYLPTTGGVDTNVAERGEGEAILPISKVPGIFAEAFASSAQAMKSMLNTAQNITNPMDNMLSSVSMMESGMRGVGDSYMDSVNVDSGGIMVLENHVTLEVGGEEFANAVVASQEYLYRSGRT